ncbi:hypothetical protein COT93_00175 [Candidatus Falkowbacteria bacterium CG10_big_fil_rev_8_21_14_0_10_37_18]|uniref:Uncharacterized protein n=1 Tax=Candidatus Falkowbacteria bacterium CG10_big_fil_rev_8_21_14_0_10_37_18 TaxID=1974562 RepID=A0A2H0V9U9_9BACT|nr:MAG: hypothetical protein COT93_00175 [Candidatus Falkowbacteria bacterium CG10_big_fil_rev_8_21_14_0_10_37_18]
MEKNKELWIRFYILLFVSSLAIATLSVLIFEVIWTGVIAGFAVVILILPITLIKAWTIVPHQYEYIVEIYGEYIGRPLMPGAYWLFPWLGFVIIKNSVFMATQLMELFLNDQSDGNYGKGSVEFIDLSVPVRVAFYFTIFDSQLSTYATNDLFRALEEKSDGVTRSFLGIYTLREATSMKQNFTVHSIATMADVRVEGFSEEEAKRVWRDSDFYKCLRKWGVEPDDIVISDFELTPEIERARETILLAEKEREVSLIHVGTAENKKQIAIKMAEADSASEELRGEGVKKSTILIGQGQSIQASLLASVGGIPAEQLVNFMVQERKWDSVKPTDKVIITNGDNNSGASYGAQVAAGFGATQSVTSSASSETAVNTEAEKEIKTEKKKN